MVKAGVIGVGYLGAHHARIYHELEDADLIAVSDSDFQRAREIADRYGCRAFEDFRDMLPHVHAVSIATPTITHRDVSLACIEKGKDLLVEKPIAPSLGEADEIIEAAQTAGRVLQIGHLERYNPAVSALTGFINDPVFMESERMSPFQGRGTDVDITLDLMIHDIDIISSLLKGAEISGIKATGASVITDRIDVAKAWLDFKGGASALITASRLSAHKRRTLKVYQTDSYLVLDYIAMNIKRYFKEGGVVVHEVIPIEQKEPLKEEIRDFIRCVMWRLKPLVSGSEGRDALAAALSISKKIKEKVK